MEEEKLGNSVKKYDSMEEAEREFEEAVYKLGIPVKSYASIEEAEEEYKEEQKRKEARRRERRRQRRKKTLYAAKGSAHEAKKRKEEQKGKKLKLSIATGALATFLAIGSVVGAYLPKEPEKSLAQIIQEEENISSLELSKESIHSLLIYQQELENGSYTEMSKRSFIEKIEELYALDLRMVKEKMAPILGCDVENIIVRYGTDKTDGRNFTSVTSYQPFDEQHEIPVEHYTDAQANFLGMADEHTLPKEVCDAVWNLEDLENLKEKTIDSRISMNNAVEELKEIVNDMAEFGSTVLVKGENEILQSVTFEKAKETEQQKDLATKKEDNERET